MQIRRIRCTNGGRGAAGRCGHRPLRVPSAVRGMAVRAAFIALIELQLLSGTGGSCAAGAAALFASSARLNRALSVFKFCRLPEPHRRGAPGSRAAALVVSSRGSLQAKNPAAGGRAFKKETDCRVGPAGPPRNDRVRLIRLSRISCASVLIRACTKNPYDIVF